MEHVGKPAKSDAQTLRESLALLGTGLACCLFFILLIERSSKDPDSLTPTSIVGIFQETLQWSLAFCVFLSSAYPSWPFPYWRRS